MSYIELYAKEAPEIKYNPTSKEPFGLEEPYLRQIIFTGEVDFPKKLFPEYPNYETVHNIILERGNYKIGNSYTYRGNIGTIKAVSYPQILGSLSEDGASIKLRYSAFLEVEF